MTFAWTICVTRPFCRAKPKDSNRSLEKWAVTVFRLRTAGLSLCYFCRRDQIIRWHVILHNYLETDPCVILSLRETWLSLPSTCTANAVSPQFTLNSSTAHLTSKQLLLFGFNVPQNPLCSHSLGAPCWCNLTKHAQLYYINRQTIAMSSKKSSGHFTSECGTWTYDIVCCGTHLCNHITIWTGISYFYLQQHPVQEPI